MESNKNLLEEKKTLHSKNFMQKKGAQLPVARHKDFSAKPELWSYCFAAAGSLLYGKVLYFRNTDTKPCIIQKQIPIFYSEIFKENSCVRLRQNTAR